MCIQQRWITNRITGIKVLVKCGKCEACQQEKASKRTTRINLETKIHVPQGRSTLFLTLTYENRYVPFILNNEYRDFINLNTNILHVLREENPHDLKRVSSTSKFKRPLRSKDMIIDTFDDYHLKSEDIVNTQCNTFMRNYLLRYSADEIQNDLPFLRKVYFKGKERHIKFLNNRVGVLYYKDVQDFIKRLRINLDRHYGIKDKFSFFCCGEYGPTSYRPHYHILLHVPSRYFAQFKRAVVESWKFDNLGEPSKYQRQIKLAEDAASYVSSYVNRSSDFPLFFDEYKFFRPSHVYSQGYGMVSCYCQLPTLLEMARQSRFIYPKVINVFGKHSVIDVPLPSYVVNRYFPKFKGFSRLTTSEIHYIITGCNRLHEYAKTIDYTDEDIKSISLSIRNHYIRYCELLGLPLNDYTLENYARDYTMCWNSYKSSIQLFAYDTLKTDSDFIYHFTNWSEKYWLHSLVKDALYIRKDMELNSKDFVSDPNKYPVNLLLHDYYTNRFHDFNKSRKIKNYVYMETSNV